MNLIFHDELISSQGTHPLLVNPPYNLTLTVAELTTPKPQDKNKKNNKDNKDNKDSESDPKNEEIPRPHNAFIIFRTDYAAKMKIVQQKISIRVISQMASSQWRVESEIVKVFFKLLADMYQQRHKNLYPNYKFAPRNKPDGIKKMTNRERKEAVKRKKEKRGKIITWYIHDNTMRKSNDTMFRHADLSIKNDDDISGNISEYNQKRGPPAPPATFINYTTSPDNPLVLHSTTTTSSRKNPNDDCSNTSSTSSSSSTLDLYDTTSPDENFIWPELPLFEQLNLF